MGVSKPSRPPSGGSNVKPPPSTLIHIPESYRTAVARFGIRVPAAVVEGREMDAICCRGCGSTKIVNGACAHCGRRRVA